jgi:hypothetical protein
VYSSGILEFGGKLAGCVGLYKRMISRRNKRILRIVDVQSLKKGIRSHAIEVLSYGVMIAGPPSSSIFERGSLPAIVTNILAFIHDCSL